MPPYTILHIYHPTYMYLRCIYRCIYILYAYLRLLPRYPLAIAPYIYHPILPYATIHMHHSIYVPAMHI